MKSLVERVDQTLDWSALPELAAWVIDTGIAIQQIPAPTFEEKQRAEYVLQLFADLGLQDTAIDDLFNVYGRYPGQDSAQPALMISAHTDTVFHRDTDLSIKKEASIIKGPGLGDNSMGVAGMLGAIKQMRDQQIIPACDVWFVAPVREEGLGDLDGMRQAYNRLSAKLKAVINLEGLAFGYVSHAGIAVKRLHITASTAGGHSWLHYGRESAIHNIIKLGERITRIVPPTRPRTTYNIGIIDGGLSINTIAATASIWVDLRSEEQNALDKLEREVRGHVSALSNENVSFDIEVVGNRPSGKIGKQHPLVQGALSALNLVNTKGVLEIGSTDGNIPLAAGCPTVTIGITRGGNAHRLDEYIDTAPVADGVRQLLVLLLATSQFTF